MQTVDQLERQVTKLERENFQLRKDLMEARVREQMKQSGVPSGGSAQVPAGDPPTSTLETSSIEGPRVVYSEPVTDPSFSQIASTAPGGPPTLMEQGRRKLDARDPQAALADFRQVVMHHPTDALADDAQFGAGECFFQMGKYEEAIAEYRRVIEGFPFGDQVPSAFLKIGFSNLAMGRRDLALDSFKTVSEAYPGTEAATVARQQIAHLRASDS
ncbi:MAG TPA: tetratricopeptide repeat protein [Candidatus Polarisedimenticolia bacterium]|nr:tetratricopeptide repeat protein [Candidatus Polarisedimenticolia bacterium]